MSPGAAPPLPSQLKVHFLYCSANLWLILELLSLWTQFTLVVALFVIYQLSHHCLTLTSSGWDTLQKLQTSVRLTSLKLFRSGFKPTTPKSISRIVHLKNNNLCGAPSSPEHPPSLSQRQPPPFRAKVNKCFIQRVTRGSTTTPFTA